MISFCNTSFLSKTKNEKEQWLEYYGLKENMFVKDGESSIQLEWNDRYSDDKFNAIPDCYSPDSNYLVQHPFYGEPEEESLLVRMVDSSAARLLYLSPGSSAEAVIWKNKYTFEIMGFDNCCPDITPTIWHYNLKKNTCTVMSAKKLHLSKPIYKWRNN